MATRFLPHTADILVELEAPDAEGIFHEATAVIRILVAGEQEARSRIARTIGLSGTDLTELLFEYLRELLYLFATETFVPARLEIDRLDFSRQGPAALAGTVLGEPFDPERHQTQPEVKAVTRHGLEVTTTEEGFRARILFDV
jgi:SHS2 domain-containing protein